MKPEYLEGTIVFLQQGNNVWLAKKTRKIGKGLFNGYGGKIEPGESSTGSSMREIAVETGGIILLPSNIQEVGEVVFHNFDDSNAHISTFKCFIHLVKKWEGTPVSTEEMKDPQLFFTDNLPFGQMMPADGEWIPYVFSGNKARFNINVYQNIVNNTLLRPIVVEWLEAA